jgi:hypothetical protein
LPTYKNLPPKTHADLASRAFQMRLVRFDLLRCGAEAGLRSSLGLAQGLKPSRKPRCHIVDKLVYAPTSGVLAELPLPEAPAKGCQSLDLDVEASVGDEVVGPEGVFASLLVEVTVVAKDLRTARALVAEMVHHPPVVVSPGVPGAVPSASPGAT